MVNGDGNFCATDGNHNEHCDVRGGIDRDGRNVVETTGDRNGDTAPGSFCDQYACFRWRKSISNGDTIADKYPQFYAYINADIDLYAILYPNRNTAPVAFFATTTFTR